MNTMLSHKSEIRDFEIIEEADNEILFVTGSNGAEIRFWSLEKVAVKKEEEEETTLESASQQQVDDSLFQTLEIGTLTRSKGDKVSKIQYTAGILAVIGTSRNADIWRILNTEEKEKKLKKRQNKIRKRNEKAAEKLQNSDEMVPQQPESIPTKLDFTDKFETIQTVYGSKPLRGLCLNLKFNKNSKTNLFQVNHIQVLFLLKDNKLEFWHGECVKDAKFEIFSKLSLLGHRFEPKILKLGNDDIAIATASRGELKIWNRISGECLRTIELLKPELGNQESGRQNLADSEDEDDENMSDDKIKQEVENFEDFTDVKMSEGYPTNILWAAGDRHIVVGLRSGEVQVYHIGSGNLRERFLVLVNLSVEF